MLMTTKNGKAIARALALALCVVMLLAFATACSDDTAARAEEAYNAALKAEEAANKANQAANNAQSSADDAMDKAEGAETLAGTKLTEKEVTAAITAALADYAKTADVASKKELTEALSKILTEEAVKALIDAGDKKVEDKVNALEITLTGNINTILADYKTNVAAKADLEALEAKIGEKLQGYPTTEAQDKAIADALEAYITAEDAEAALEELETALTAAIADNAAAIEAIKTTAAETKTANDAAFKKLTDDLAALTKTVADNLVAIDTAIVNYDKLQQEIKEYAHAHLVGNDDIKGVIEIKIEETNATKADSKFYTQNGFDAITRAYDVALITILTAPSKAAIDTAYAEFVSAIENRPTVEKDYYDLLVELQKDDLRIELINTAEGVNETASDKKAVKDTLAAINALLGDADFVAAHPNAFTAYKYDANDDTKVIDLDAAYKALSSEIDTLEAAWNAAETENTGVNALINALDDTYGLDREGKLDNIAKYEKHTELDAAITAIDNAIATWINTYFANDTDNVNIGLMLYNRYDNLEDETEDNILNTAKDLQKKFGELEEYGDKINALVGTIEGATVAPTTKWNAGVDGYILINNLVGEKTEKQLIDELKALYDADEAIYTFQTACAFADEYAALNGAAQYAAYAADVEIALTAIEEGVEGDKSVADALVALAAIKGAVDYKDHIDPATNVFTVAAGEYTAWTAASTEKLTEGDNPTVVYPAGITLENETIVDILDTYNETLVADLDAVDARREVLEVAKFYADVLNAGVNADCIPVVPNDAAYKGIYGFVKVDPNNPEDAYSTLKTYYINTNEGVENATPAYEKVSINAFEPDTVYYTAVTVKLGINDFLKEDAITPDENVVKYYHVIELKQIEDLIADWKHAFTIDSINEDLVNEKGRKDAYAAADELIDYILYELDEDGKPIKGTYNTLTDNARKAMNAFNNATNGSHTTLYGYVLINATIDAYQDWVWGEYKKGNIDIEITVTDGIERFTEDNLDLEIGLANLYVIKNDKYLGTDGTVTNATKDYDASLSTTFGESFDIEAYVPTVYDQYVRDAYLNVTEWVKNYLDTRGFTFTVNNESYTINSIGLLTEDVYKNVLAAYAEYEKLVEQAETELTAIETATNAFKVEGNFVVNIITANAEITRIEDLKTAWAEAYVKVGATGAIDETVADYETVAFKGVTDLRAAYTTIYNDVAQNYNDNKQTIVDDIGEGYTAGLYSMVAPLDELYLANKAYDEYIVPALKIDDTTSGAYKDYTGNDELIINLKNAIDAIEAREAEVKVLADAKNAQGDAFVESLKAIRDLNNIGTADAEAIKAAREAYTAWRADIDLNTLDNPNNAEYVYNSQAIIDALAALEQAETDIAAIKTLLTNVVNAYNSLAALDKTPDELVIGVGLNDIDAWQPTEWATAAETLIAAVKAYTEGNSDALAAGKLVSTKIDDVELTADMIDGKAATNDTAEIISIYTYEALYGSINALKRAQKIYSQYEAEALLVNEAKISSLKALRDNMIKIIVDDAKSEQHKSYSTEAAVNRVESFLAAQMDAIMKADGSPSKPSFDDTKDDWDTGDYEGTANNK